MEQDHQGNVGNVKVVGYWVSLFVHRVRWALSLKGIKYEYIEEDIFNRGPLLSEVNPVYGKVPVLIHHGNPLPESRVILEYIDDAWKHVGPALLPANPYERAQARFWARFVDEKILEAAWNLMFTRGEKKEKAIEVATELLDKIEQRLLQKGKRFLGGDAIGYEDFVLGFMPQIFPAWEEVAGVKVVDPVRFPAITAWTDNFLNHPVVKAEYTPPWDETLAFYKKRWEELMPVYIARGE